MRFRRAREEEPGFSSIAPLIDIVFLLLIFFMVTTHSPSVSGLSISLPETGADHRGGENPTVAMTIDGTGKLLLDGVLIEPGALAGELARLRSGDGPFHLLLEADRNVSHGRVVEVMDTAKQAGAASITIAAYLTGREEP